MSEPAPPIKAPFPAFGCKSRIADAIIARLDGPAGTVAYDPARNWIEPFAFSAAVTLRRPCGAVETINDRNHFVSNFWRAVQADPDAVAEHADWPVNECDLHARHAWLVASADAAARLDRVREDPGYFDARIAGWWCWGACCWIGAGWCDETHRNSGTDTRPDLGGQMVTALSAAGKMPLIGDRTALGRRVPGENMPSLRGDSGASGVGVCASPGTKRVKLSGNGVGNGVHANSPRERQPAIAQNGWGINAAGMTYGGTHRPQLADAYSRGRGVNGHDVCSTCADRRAWVTAWMRRLADRLRSVRVCCGHWDRVCDSPSTMTRLGTTAVVLDPPYRHSIVDADGVATCNRTKHIYANDKVQDVDALCDEVQAWCLRWGEDKDVRIALCGLSGEYPEIERLGTWEIMEWKAQGGYGNRNGGGENVNAARERIWFSPGCRRVGLDVGLFDESVR